MYMKEVIDTEICCTYHGSPCICIYSFNLFLLVSKNQFLASNQTPTERIGYHITTCNGGQQDCCLCTCL